MKPGYLTAELNITDERVFCESKCRGLSSSLNGLAVDIRINPREQAVAPHIGLGIAGGASENSTLIDSRLTPSSASPESPSLDGGFLSTESKL
jgi:hypothetical protein